MEEVKIKDLKEYEEYIDKKDEVLKILDEVDFTIEDNGLLFNQYNYIVTIYNKDKSVSIEYYEGIGNEPLNESNATDKVISMLWCTLQDYNYTTNIYENNILDFIEDFGYDVKEGRRIFSAMIENTNKLLEVFTKEDLEFLKDNINL